MNMETQRLILRSWAENDAESLYNYAKCYAIRYHVTLQS